MRIEMLLVILSLALCVCDYKIDTGDMKVVNSRLSTFDNGYTEDLTIIVNKKKIVNVKKCAMEIIKNYFKNDFKEVYFCFTERGYPNKLTATVFLTEEDWENCKPIFRMIYKSDLIKDNSMNYKLEIEEAD